MMLVEIYIEDDSIQFFHEEELLYECETTSYPAYVVENILSSLGFDVLITDNTKIEEDENTPEPFYEEDLSDNLD